MIQYRVSFLVYADSPKDAVSKVREHLAEGGEADSVDGNWAPAPMETEA